MLITFDDKSERALYWTILKNTLRVCLVKSAFNLTEFELFHKEEEKGIFNVYGLRWWSIDIESLQ